MVYLFVELPGNSVIAEGNIILHHIICIYSCSKSLSSNFTDVHGLI